MTQISTMNTQTPDWLTPEVKEMLDRRVEGIENGTTKLIPHEQVMRELDEFFERLDLERKRIREYATV